MAQKRVLDPLVYVDAQNIFFNSGYETKITTEVYGRSHTAIVSVRLGDSAHIEITYHPKEYLESTQTIYLTTTKCYFGGFRWWLLCPQCNRRARKLYLVDRYACRFCHNLAYRSQRRNRHSPLYSAQKELDRQEKAEKLLQHLRSKIYNGQPTKRYLKIMELMYDKNVYSM